jgi:hypothetical protein
MSLSAVSILLSLCLGHVGVDAAFPSVPSDPKALARLVGDAFLKEAEVSCQGTEGHNMLSWNYGGALILDGMFQVARQCPL